MDNSAYIKASLDRLLEENDNVFVVPHIRPDFDAIGAAIGIALICKKNNKNCFIVIDDDYDKLEPETRKVLENIKNNFNFIRSNDLPIYLTPRSMMVAVDANKDYLLCTKNYLSEFKNIVVIDHHKTDEHTIKTPYLFVDESISSVCEEVSRLLFLYGVKLSPDYANYLLAGIILDTNKLSKNTNAKTFEVASKLTASGADPTIANNMFLEDFEHDRAIQRLVDNTDFQNYIFAIASDSEDSGRIYEPEDIAKAADYLLKYNINCSFAMAYIDDITISVSARSKGLIDVSKIMRLFGGGGNEYSAAAKIKGKNLQEVKSLLISSLMPGAYIENANISFVDEKPMKLTMKKSHE